MSSVDLGDAIEQLIDCKIKEAQQPGSQSKPDRSGLSAFDAARSILQSAVESVIREAKR